MPDEFGSARDALFRIERELGEIKGAFSGLLREMTRQNAALELHLSDDARVHAAQDDRMVAQLGTIGERVAVLEQAKSKADGERGAARLWSEWIRVGFGAAAAAGATLLGTSLWRH